MAHHPAYTVGGLCVVGGLAGFARTRSMPSLLAGVGVGLSMGAAGYMIQNGREGGRELATAASAALLLSSSIRFGKGPVPKALTVLGAGSSAYYANQSYRWHKGY